MKRLMYFKYLFVFFMLLEIVFSAAAAGDILQIGSKGKQVREVQNYLYRLKYMRIPPTGYYGRLTAEAIKSFQLEHGLACDGKTGRETLTALKAAFAGRNSISQYTVLAGDTLAKIAEKFTTTIVEIMVLNRLQDEEVAEGQKLSIPAGRYPVLSSRGINRRTIQAVPWSIMEQLWPRDETVKIYDLETGKSFQVRRYGGYYHADGEPLTKEDTQTFKEIYGGKWSWNRRPVIVECRNLYIAASINGMPHGGRKIYNNDFKGHFCIHFLGSRLHKNGSVDRTHQAAVGQAATANLNLSPLGQTESGTENIPEEELVEVY